MIRAEKLLEGKTYDKDITNEEFKEISKKAKEMKVDL
jgi:hypothetical protein